MEKSFGELMRTSVQSLPWFQSQPIMKILHTIRVIFTSIGLCSHNPHEATSLKWKYVPTVLFIILFLALVVLELSSILYFVEHLKIGDVKNSLFAALQFTGAFSLTGSFLLICYSKRNVRSALDGFQNAFNRCNE